MQLICGLGYMLLLDVLADEGASNTDLSSIEDNIPDNTPLEAEITNPPTPESSVGMQKNINFSQSAAIDFSEVVELLQQKQGNVAIKKLQQIEESIQCPQRIPSKQDLAKISMYRGFAWYVLKQDVKLQESWREAFGVDIKMQLDTKLIHDFTEEDSESLLNYFEQNRGLVEMAGFLDPKIPEQVGEAQLFIDGAPVVAGDTVKPAKHLAQIVCPNDNLQSRWVTFEASDSGFDWFALCPSGVDTSVEVESDDMFGGFFENSVDTSSIYNPEPICETSGFHFAFSTANLEKKDLYMTAGGATLLSLGVVSYYAWLTPAFHELEDARTKASLGEISATDADAISSHFNTARWSTIGLLVTGVGVTAYGSTRLIPVSTGNWYGISGAF